MAAVPWDSKCKNSGDFCKVTVTLGSILVPSQIREIESRWALWGVEHEDRGLALHKIETLMLFP